MSKIISKIIIAIFLSISFGSQQKISEPYGYLLGEWETQVSEKILKINGEDVSQYDLNILGFTLVLANNTSIVEQIWYEEGVLYGSKDKDDTRLSWSSFDWLVGEQFLVFHITLSVAGLPEDTEFLFPFDYNNETDELTLFTDIDNDEKITFARIISDEEVENDVISSIRAGLKQAANNSLLTGGRATWPTNPFDALKDKPSGHTTDDSDADVIGEWTFNPTKKRITHRRNDNSVWYWEYNKGKQKGWRADIGSLGKRKIRP